jgi:hypothetical protein
MMRGVALTRAMFFIIIIFCVSCTKPKQDEEVIINQNKGSSSSSESILSKPITVENNQQPELAGQFFDTPVPISNYYFAKKVVATFSAPWRGNPTTLEELEDLTWQELVLSYEVFRRNITVSEEEVFEEVDKTLKADKVEFDRKEDIEAYSAWAKDKLNGSTESFENQMEHLLQLRKLREEVIDSITPEVTEEEAKQKFLDEYNSLSVELVEVEELEEAESFYKKAIKPAGKHALDELIWDDLILSYEAYKRSVELSEEDSEKVLIIFLREADINFRWQTEEDKFKEWVNDKFSVSVDVLKARINHFALIDKLRQSIFSTQAPAIDEGGRYEKFRLKNKNVPNSFDKFFGKFKAPKDAIERLGTFKKAKKVYESMKREPGFWEDSKRENPAEFRRPGFVALDFLINIWGFKRDDAYSMLKLKKNNFYKPSPIYKGYGVFKILNVRKAEEEKYKEREQYYYDRVGSIKKHKGFKDWLDQITKDANIKVFIENN